MGHCLTREDKMENSWLDIAMRDKEDHESDKQMGKQQTERQTACCYRHAAIGMLRSMLPLQHIGIGLDIATIVFPIFVLPTF